MSDKKEDNTKIESETHRIMSEFSKVLKHHVEQQDELWSRISNIIATSEKNIAFDILPVKTDITNKYLDICARIETIQNRDANISKAVVDKITKSLNIKIAIVTGVLVVAMIFGGIAFLDVLDHFHQMLETMKELKSNA